MPAFEPEGEFGADPDGLAGFVEEVVGYVSVADDGEAPVVEGDQFGEDLGAQLPAVAGDGVDPQPDAVVIAVSVVGRAGCWLSGWRSTSLGRAVPVRARRR